MIDLINRNKENVDKLTRARLILLQAALDSVIHNDDSLLARYTALRANRISRSSTSHTSLVAIGARSVEIVFRFRTLRNAEFTILNVHTFGTIIRSRSSARIPTFRMAHAAIFGIQRVDVRQTVTRVQTNTIKFEILAF